jgi:hypothetical protein
MIMSCGLLKHAHAHKRLTSLSGPVRLAACLAWLPGWLAAELSRGVLLLLLGDPGDIVEPLRTAAEERWQSTAPAHHGQTRLIVHVSLARILYFPPPDGAAAVGSSGDSRELSAEQIRRVEAACTDALEGLGLQGLEFYADALWYVELQSADLTERAYERRFPLHEQGPPTAEQLEKSAEEEEEEEG